MVTFCLTAIARDFQKSDAQVALIITFTLALRPIGSLIFGAAADRFGRRRPLMVNIGLFACAEILTGIAPNYTFLLIVRALFGMIMGGNWGLGASLAMESAASNNRGIFSGILQEGYAAGNVLAALCYFALFNRMGWRALFFVGTIPAIVLVLFIRFGVKESDVWQRRAKKVHSWQEQSLEFVSHWKLFLYMLAFMTAMIFASHGTQDMYPTFLQREWHFNPAHRSAITAFAGIGGMVGGVIFGYLSDRWGRRRTVVTAFGLGVLIIPVWAYAPNPVVLVAGAFLIQCMVQGAWGVVPAHLVELSPDSMRALMPGFAYQSAAVLGSSVVYLEAIYAERATYATAMALTAVSSFILASILVLCGRERRGQQLG